MVLRLPLALNLFFALPSLVFPLPLTASAMLITQWLLRIESQALTTAVATLLWLSLLACTLEALYYLSLRHVLRRQPQRDLSLPTAQAVP